MTVSTLSISPAAWSVGQYARASANTLFAAASRPVRMSPQPMKSPDSGAEATGPQPLGGGGDDNEVFAHGSPPCPGEGAGLQRRWNPDYPASARGLPGSGPFGRDAKTCPVGIIRLSG